jgi:hypothetical protein
MLKKMLGISVAAMMALTGLVAVVPAYAGTVTNGTLTITALPQVWQSGCYEYLISYSVGSPLTGYSWNLEVTASGWAGGSLDFATGDGPASGTVHAFMCGLFENPPGTHLVHAVLTSSSDSDGGTGPGADESTTLIIATTLVTHTSLSLVAPVSVNAGAYAIFSGKLSLQTGAPGSPVGQYLHLYYKVRGSTAYVYLPTASVLSSTGTWARAIRLYHPGYFYVWHPAQGSVPSLLSPSRYVAVA